MSKIHNIFFDFVGGEKRRISASLALSLILHLCVALGFFYFFVKQDLRFKKGQDAQKIKISGFLKSIDSESLKNEQNFQNLNKNVQARNSQNVDSQKQNLKKTSKQDFEKKADSSKALDFENLTLANSAHSQGDGGHTSQYLSKIFSRYGELDLVTKRDVIELYGDEIGDYGLVEQDFIVNNLRDIGRITARYLRYPQDAVRLGQQGVNIVQFYLHPNGDISDLRLIKESGYAILDRNSERTIEIAYKDYPRPLTKTKIRIRVSMELYYY